MKTGIVLFKQLLAIHDNERKIKIFRLFFKGALQSAVLYQKKYKIDFTAAKVKEETFTCQGG